MNSDNVYVSQCAGMHACFIQLAIYKDLELSKCMNSDVTYNTITIKSSMKHVPRAHEAYILQLHAAIQRVAIC